ncbi:hypothetical protein N7527_002840 [Penicillium freii]|nr:hypothetical protein N7527_002840 [Penicillium freii]
MALSYSLEPDDKIAIYTSQEIRVRIDLIQTGDALERTHATVPFFESSIAPMSDLLRLSAVHHSLADFFQDITWGHRIHILGVKGRAVGNAGSATNQNELTTESWADFGILRR